MKAYLITLRPHEQFFFGGENTFGEANANYFVKSRFFPQQTALLGLMRYQILAAHGLLSTKRNKHKLNGKASSYIGLSSFDSDSNQVKTLQDFGHIGGVSHLFLKEKDTVWNFASKDLGFTYESVAGQSVVNSTNTSIPHIPNGYVYKKGITAKMVSNMGKTKPIEDFFTTHSQVGIAKNRKGKQADKENSKQFYKLHSQRFSSADMSFAFVAYLNEDATAIQLQNYLQSNPNVFFGGERSIFKMEMEEHLTEDWEQHQLEHLSQTQTKLHKLILLSDAYADAKEVYDNCDFAVSEVVNFQHIVTKVNQTENYNDLNRKHKKHQKVSKSNAFNLLQKGSVFYTSSEEQLNKLAAVFEAAEAFRQIGYNAFVTYNTQTQTNFFTPKQLSKNDSNK